MTASEREQIEKQLAKIPRETFNTFLASEVGEPFQRRLDVVRQALKEAGRFDRTQWARRPMSELLDLLGERLLSEEPVGFWVRRELIWQLATRKYRLLARAYRNMAGKRAVSCHGNMEQHRQGSKVLASYWHQGSDWAFEFCDIVGLPDVLARRQGRVFPPDEEVVPSKRLAPLHTFQVEVYRKLRKFLSRGKGKAAMLSLPTGAGKTRVTVQAICDHLAELNGGKGRRNQVLWVSQSDELQRQAWECFRDVWQARGFDAHGAGHTTTPLQLVRLWGGRGLESVPLSDEPTVFIAGIDQLSSWVRTAARGSGDLARQAREVLHRLKGRRALAVVVDEAHHLTNDEHRRVLVRLGIRAARSWSPTSNTAPVIGLTATPWRTQKQELGQLIRFFQHKLLTPGSLGRRPINALQRKKVLARAMPQRIRGVVVDEMTSSQRARFDRFKDLPADYLEQLGRHPERNAAVLKRLERLPKKARTLVFACGVKHAEALAMALNRMHEDDVARVITAGTPRGERLAIIDQFRRGDGVRFLVNVGVLTTGFDAPKIDVVCITRPTTSAILYEQMVGRGLRGPRNGGSSSCRVIDVQDRNLPNGILSYGRVIEQWDGRRRQA